MTYSRPRIISHNSSSLIESIGPAVTQAYLDVGGGRQAMLNTDKIECYQEHSPPSVQLAQVKIKVKTKTKV